MSVILEPKDGEIGDKEFTKPDIRLVEECNGSVLVVDIVLVNGNESKLLNMVTDDGATGTKVAVETLHKVEQEATDAKLEIVHEVNDESTSAVLADNDGILDSKWVSEVWTEDLFDITCIVSVRNVAFDNVSVSVLLAFQGGQLCDMQLNDVWIDVELVLNVFSDENECPSVIFPNTDLGTNVEDMTEVISGVRLKATDVVIVGDILDVATKENSVVLTTENVESRVLELVKLSFKEGSECADPSFANVVLNFIIEGVEVMFLNDGWPVIVEKLASTSNEFWAEVLRALVVNAVLNIDVKRVLVVFANDDEKSPCVWTVTLLESDTFLVWGVFESDIEKVSVLFLDDVGEISDEELFKIEREVGTDPVSVGIMEIVLLVGSILCGIVLATDCSEITGYELIDGNVEATEEVSNSAIPEIVRNLVNWEMLVAFLTEDGDPRVVDLIDNVGINVRLKSADADRVDANLGLGDEEVFVVFANREATATEFKEVWIETRGYNPDVAIEDNVPNVETKWGSVKFATDGMIVIEENVPEFWADVTLGISIVGGTVTNFVSDKTSVVFANVVEESRVVKMDKVRLKVGSGTVDGKFDNTVFRISVDGVEGVFLTDKEVSVENSLCSSVRFWLETIEVDVENIVLNVDIEETCTKLYEVSAEAEWQYAADADVL